MVAEIIDLVERIRRSPLLRILMVGGLILVLQAPVSMIRGVIRERKNLEQEAISEIVSKWGPEQHLMGPIVTVPYVERWVETVEGGSRNGEEIARSRTRYADFLPEALEISGRLDTEVRYRGIFKVPVYRMALVASGHFTRPDLSEWDIEPSDVLWDQAALSIGLSMPQAITNQVKLSWNGEQLGFLPGSGDSRKDRPGIHVPLGGRLEGEHFDFSIPLEVNGSSGAFWAPLGRETRVEISSNWPDPSFQGCWLPSERSTGEDGFQAVWSVPFLARDYPQCWRSGEAYESQISSSGFGVRLLTPIDPYRMAERSVKYQALFLALTFGTIWLFEVLGGLRIHPVQYLLVGAGMCVFYLLELSLAEHIGFGAAYALASGAVIVQLGAYCRAVLGSAKRSGTVGIVVAILYGYLYMLLRNQEYALLAGSIGLFAAVTAVMYLTRKVDWRRPPNSRGTRGERA